MYPARPWNCLLTTTLAALTVSSLAQTIQPSNSSTDIGSYKYSPYFWVNSTKTASYPSFHIVPLGWYAQISRNTFLSISEAGHLVLVTGTTLGSYPSDGIEYLSCDPEDYTNSNLDGNTTFQSVVANDLGNAIVLYSKTSDHCIVNTLTGTSVSGGIFTAIGQNVSQVVSAYLQKVGSIGAPTQITPDQYAYTATNGSLSTFNGGPVGGTTAIAMIILYTVTGLITAIFVLIIITGALRAHRHPERYGPRNVAGRPRQSRARGIGRAMLETIPLVKFGDKNDVPIKKVETEQDIELAHVVPVTEVTEDKSAIRSNLVQAPSDLEGGATMATPIAADIELENNNLACSICTEDFEKGEEVRVLPCDHKFHAICVDPWLLNVSGTCPLCRIDLRSKEQQEADAQIRPSGLNPADFPVVPPGPGTYAYENARRHGSFANVNLRNVMSGTREDRIAALRQLRQQRRTRSTTVSSGPEREAVDESEDRRTLSARLRDRFRVRTRRAGEPTGDVEEHAASSRVPDAPEPGM